MADMQATFRFEPRTLDPLQPKPTQHPRGNSRVTLSFVPFGGSSPMLDVQQGIPQVGEDTSLLLSGLWSGAEAPGMLSKCCMSVVECCSRRCCDTVRNEPWSNFGVSLCSRMGDEIPGSVQLAVDGNLHVFLSHLGRLLALPPHLTRFRDCQDTTTLIRAFETVLRAMHV